MQLRSTSLALILCACLLAAFQPLHAQDDNPYQDGCDSAPQTQIASISKAFDYAGACSAYRACANTDNGSIPESCQLEALRVLSASCVSDSTVCRQTALLYASAIQSFISLDVWGADPAVQAQILDGIVRGLTAFQRGDYAAAAQAYALDDTSGVGIHMLPLARAVIDQALNKPADALTELNTGLSAAPADPLLLLVQAEVYGGMGAAERASIDVEILRQDTASSPELSALVAPLVAQYPFDASRLQDWTLYPVLYWGGGPGGGEESDESQSAPRTIRMGMYQDQTVILAIDLDENNSACYSAQICLNWITLAGDGSNYDADFPLVLENSSHIHLTRMGDVWIGSENRTEFEGSATYNYIITPAGSADPRADLQGARCGVISRLQPNMTDVSSMWDPNNSISMYDKPNGKAIAHPDAQTATYSITGKGECDHDVMWWPVRDDQGDVGWMAENSAQNYLLLPPVGVSDVPLYCPDTPPTRLWKGARGIVAPQFGANVLRVQPDVKAASITTLPAGSAFTITDGPVCAGGYVWWQVSYQQATGWTAEGQGDQYWLVPQ